MSGFCDLENMSFENLRESAKSAVHFFFVIERQN